MLDDEHAVAFYTYGKNQHKFVSGRKSTVPDLVSKDEFAKTITKYIVLVSAYHNVVGKVAEYVMHPDFMSGAIKPGSEVGDVQKSLGVLAVTISTGTPFPLITSDFTHLLLRGGSPESTAAKQVFGQFQTELIAQAAVIEQRNVDRRSKGQWTCNHFNPANTEPSISV